MGVVFSQALITHAGSCRGMNTVISCICAPCRPRELYDKGFLDFQVSSQKRRPNLAVIV